MRFLYYNVVYYIYIYTYKMRNCLIYVTRTGGEASIFFYRNCIKFIEGFFLCCSFVIKQKKKQKIEGVLFAKFSIVWPQQIYNFGVQFI